MEINEIKNEDINVESEELDRDKEVVVLEEDKESLEENRNRPSSNYNSLTKGKYLSTSRMMFIAILVAQGLIMFWLESQLPINLGTPGAKLGLANIFTVVAIYTLDPLSSFLVVILRILLSTFIAKTLVSLLYSMTGGILSFIVMTLLVKFGKNKFSGMGISISGAVFHNFGQVLMASIILQNPRVMYYLPMLGIIAVPTGLFVGITASFMIEHLRKLSIYRRIRNIN